MKNLKIGIVGCGKIADSHASQILRISNCEIVGVCDKEILMAKQLYERFPIKRYFDDIRTFLTECNPDVIHITTPPQTHYEIGKICLESGCHIYVEKPFTVNMSEAEELIYISKKKNVKLTVGHDDQFTHAARRMRELIRRGYLGGDPIHMESYYCYDLGDEQYAKAMLGDKDHWVRGLPGTLMQNNISHGICRIAEYIYTDNPYVMAYGIVSPLLKNIGETGIIDEARVVISDRDHITAYFTFSTQIRPVLRQFRIFGPKNGLLLDHDQQTLIRIKGDKYRSYLEKFVPNGEFSIQYLTNMIYNMKCFLKNDFHMKSGMKFLIESFYSSVINDTLPPISYREIIQTSRLMDEIFAQLSNSEIDY